MRTIFDHLKYNDVLYSQLQDDFGKQQLERFVIQVRKRDLEQIILSFPEEYRFNARDYSYHPHEFISGFPEDLTFKLMSIWVHLDDKVLA